MPNQTTISKSEFQIVPQELAPAYRKVKAAVARDLEKVRQLSEKEELTEREKRQIPVLLNRVARKAFRMVKRRVWLHNFLRTVGRRKLDDFQRDFGHIPPQLLIKGKELGKVAAICVANGIVQSTLFSGIGSGVGVLTMTGHTVPTVKIHGTTYVFENNLNRAVTVQEYVKKLQAHHKEEYAPLSDIAWNIVPRRKASAKEFAAALHYFGGSGASLSGAHLNFGIVLREVGRLDEAAQHFERAVKLNPQDDGSLYGLGMTRKKQGRFREAETLLRKAIKINPTAANSHDLLGQILFEQRRYLDSVQAFLNAHKLKPGSADILAVLGGAELEGGMPEAAFDNLKKAMELDPRNALAHNNIGAYYSRRWEHEKALKHFRVAAELGDLDNTLVHNNLAKTLLQLGRDAEADKHYKIARSLKTKSQ